MNRKKIYLLSNLLLLIFFIIPFAVGDTGTGTVTIQGGVSPPSGGGGSNMGFDWIPLEQTIDDPNIIINPISENYDLEQLGTLGSPYILTLNDSFDYISSITWTLSFTATTLDIKNKFAIASPLTNGINLFYNDVSLLANQNITTIEDFSNQEFSAYKFVILSDEVQQREMIAKWLYLQQGLRITPLLTYEIYIQDDLSALQNVTEFSATIEGYSLYTLDPNNPNSNRQDILSILSDLFRDNGQTLFLMGITAFSFVLVVRFFKRR